jgi:hypothetical protein
MVKIIDINNAKKLVDSQFPEYIGLSISECLYQYYFFIGK